MPLKYVYGQDELVADFVSAMVPWLRHQRGLARGAKTIGIVDEQDELIAGIVFHGWDIEAETVEISGAALPGRPWLTRQTIRLMGEYPFVQCRCQMVVQRTPAWNERLLRQLAAAGYDFILIPRLFGRDKDGVVCLLTYEAWISNKFTRRFRRGAEAEQEGKAA